LWVSKWIMLQTSTVQITPEINSILFGYGMGGESVDAALLRAIQGRADLLRQRRAHGASDAGSSRVH
jgi:hypothetical protein